MSTGGRSTPEENELHAGESVVVAMGEVEVRMGKKKKMIERLKLFFFIGKKKKKVLMSQQNFRVWLFLGLTFFFFFCANFFFLKHATIFLCFVFFFFFIIQSNVENNSARQADTVRRRSNQLRSQCLHRVTGARLPSREKEEPLTVMLGNYQDLEDMPPQGGCTRQ